LASHLMLNADMQVENLMDFSELLFVAVCDE
jgi:hypothetical protein